MELLIDANNNSSEKSYSLRPRVAPKKDDEDSDQDQETARPNAKKKKKSKQKPGRLSKYRRKTANARERSRMREINEAFEALRRAIPHLTPNNDNGEKLTKISTLRLAMKYITALSNALSDSPGESDGESFFSDYSLTTSEPREHSMTPSSISDHSDFYDQFFQKSLSGNLSPCEPTVLNNTQELTYPVRDCDPSFRNAATTMIRTLTTNSASAPLDPLPSFYQVSTSILTPEVCDRVPPSFHPTALQVPEPVFKNNSFPSGDLPEPSPSTDLDSLLYPSLNFDELFIT